MTINGSSVAGSILSVLDRVNNQLGSQAGSIDSATLIDALRSVISSIGPSTRVLGLVEPQVHLAIAGGEELKGASLLESQYQTLAARVSHDKSSAGYVQETRFLSDLASNIAFVSSNATRDVQAVLALAPAGYPGNKATILSIRAQLAQFRSSLGQLNTATNDVNQIQILLSQRAS